MTNSENVAGSTEPNHEQLQRERDAWEESAAQFCRGAEYYRGLLDRIGRAIGPEAHVADDGSVSEDVLRAKVPEIIEKRLAATPGLLAACKAQHQAIDRLFCHLILLSHEHTPNEPFFPSKSGQPWEACQLGNAAIKKAEGLEMVTEVIVDKLDPKYESDPAFGDVTKRELFAAMALQGLLSQPTMPPDGWAKMAVLQADQLLEELAK